MYMYTDIHTPLSQHTYIYICFCMHEYTFVFSLVFRWNSQDGRLGERSRPAKRQASKRPRFSGLVWVFSGGDRVFTVVFRLLGFLKGFPAGFFKGVARGPVTVLGFKGAQSC